MRPNFSVIFEFSKSLLVPNFIDSFSSLPKELKGICMFVRDMEINLSNKQKELIEKFGVIQEGMGLPPAAARVNALLTVSPELELTFDQIREALKLSKSATSNAINFLQQQESIGYKTHLGDRKRYFFSKLAGWKDKFRKNILDFNSYPDIIREIYESRKKDTDTFNEQLAELVDFMDYYVAESIAIIDRWEKQ